MTEPARDVRAHRRRAALKRRGVIRAAVALVFLTALNACATYASAAETCRYSGTTDYDGHVAVTTTVAEAQGRTTVNVAVIFDATSMVWFHVHYLAEEVSTWRAGELESVALNTRYMFAERIVRQQWDEYRRGPNGLAAYRVQSKTLAEFRLKHPGFVAHWDPASFGQPWQADYQSAPPERRADLDLPNATLPQGLRLPLAAAFYWIRWLHQGTQDVPVFLPGFKADRLANLSITAVPWAATGTLLRAPLTYPALSAHPASTATAWVESDGRLMQLAFDVHASNGAAQGTIKLDGCSGVAVAPADWRQ